LKIIEIDIEKTAFGGYGLGFYENKVIFVKLAIPGDRVRAVLTEEKKDYSFASVNEIIKPSPDRINPECKNFGKCGGCTFLNTTYENELNIKRDIIIDSLKRTGHLNENNIPQIQIISDKRFGYRSHATLKTADGNSGFFEEGSNRLIPFPDKGCLLLAPSLKKNIKKNPVDIKEYRIASDHDERVFTTAENKSVIREIESGIIFEREISLFFQANRYLRSEMLRTTGDYSCLDRNKTFIDIGCGSGFFSLYLAGIAKSGTGFDINRESIIWAKHNASLNKITNISFIKKSASEIHPARYSPETVIADPPRAGLSKKTRQTIISMQPETIVYISCNPSTFARDSATFRNSGYELKKLSLIDMFPGTYHIEVISQFKFQAKV